MQITNAGEALLQKKPLLHITAVSPTQMMETVKKVDKDETTANYPSIMCSAEVSGDGTKDKHIWASPAGFVAALQFVESHHKVNVYESPFFIHVITQYNDAYKLFDQHYVTPAGHASGPGFSIYSLRCLRK